MIAIYRLLNVSSYEHDECSIDIVGRFLLKAYAFEGCQNVLTIPQKTRKMKSQKILSKAFIKQTLVDNRKTLRKYGVKRIGLFGSYARGTATAASDIDFLVELERLTFRDYMGLALFLEDLFEKDVDLLTPTSIKPGFKPYIEKETEYVTEL